MKCWSIIAILPVAVFLTSVAESAETPRVFFVNGTIDLETALEEVWNYLAEGSGSYFKLLISDGQYSLTNSSLATFQNLTQVSIEGESEKNTVIDGLGENGFVFKEVDQLTIANITFKNCSTQQNSSTNIYQPSNIEFIPFTTSLFLVRCSRVYFQSVTVTNALAVGLTVYNIYDKNNFTSCTFSLNNPPPSSLSWSSGNTNDRGSVGHGGGGVIVDFTFCRQGDLECNDSNPVEVFNSTVTFTSCSFYGNKASSNGLQNDIVYQHGVQHVGFGKGGGLAVYFRGRSISNSVVLKNCVVSSNRAKFGHGIFVSFMDESQRNIFNMTGDVGGGTSVIGLNGEPCYYHEENKLNLRQVSSGGGALIYFNYYPSDHTLWPGYHANVINNKVEFRGTYFDSNMACWGGGASVVSSRSAPGLAQTNSILFSNSYFEENKAISASGVSLSLLQPDSIEGQPITATISDCVFSNNSASIPDCDVSGYMVGLGAVHLNHISANFTGQNNFTYNIGSGLVSLGGEIFVNEGATLLFEGNLGRRGGALVVIGGGSIIAYPRTSLVFRNNVASELGGAIYWESVFGEGDLSYQQCFIRYYEPTLQHSLWNTSFSFYDNSASQGKQANNTIHVTSLLPCVGPNGKIDRAFCWSGWVYNGMESNQLDNCSNYISTDPAIFDGALNLYLSLYPGHSTPLPVSLIDDYSRTIDQVVLQISSRNNSKVKIADSSTYVTNNEVVVYGELGESDRGILLETLGPYILTTYVKLTILPCPPGYIEEFDDDQNDVGQIVRKCKCAFSHYFTCNTTNLTAQIQPGYCVRYNNSGSGSETPQNDQVSHQIMVVVVCPATVLSVKPVNLPSCNNGSEHCNLETEFCDSINRTGRYCSSCKSGHAVDVNDIHSCVQCRNVEYTYGWFIYILTNLVPITIFFFVVTLFRISATSAPMYAFVFFAQMTTVRYFHNQLPWVFGLSQNSNTLKYLLLIPYSFWNLDFFIFTGVICLSKDFTVLYALLLKYLLALYPMLLILMSYICIEMYDHNYRVVVCLWRPFRAWLKKYRRSWQPKTSIVDAFATFLVISYTKVAVVTISLLSPATEHYVFRDGEKSVRGGTLFYFDPKYNYFEGLHLFTGILALVVGVVFVLAPPIFLLLYPTKIFQRCLNRCPGRSWQTVHIFADAFQGCFKNHTNNNRDYRYFSGLYLLLRIVFLVTYAIDYSEGVQLLLNQVFCILAVLILALVKPYKEPFFNKVDLSIFTILSLMSSLSFANYTAYENNEMSIPLFAINYALGFIPLIYISLYIFYLFLVWRGVINTDPFVKEVYIGKSTTSLTSEDSSTSDIPDRLLHPENYNSINTLPTSSSISDSPYTTDSTSPGATGSTSTTEEKKPAQQRRPAYRATEGSYFLNRARHMKNYSSM